MGYYPRGILIYVDEEFFPNLEWEATDNYGDPIWELDVNWKRVTVNKPIDEEDSDNFEDYDGRSGLIRAFDSFIISPRDQSKPLQITVYRETWGWHWDSITWIALVACFSVPMSLFKTYKCYQWTARTDDEIKEHKFKSLKKDYADIKYYSGKLNREERK